MGQTGPLDHPGLRDVDQLLDGGNVNEAQQRLADVGSSPELSDGVAYLSTRLLHVRGRIDTASAIERLNELLGRVPDFAEARSLLADLRSFVPKNPTTVRARPERPVEPEAVPLTRATFPSEVPSGRPSMEKLPVPEIPRAPGIPNFHDNHQPPSYVPGRKPSAALPGKGMLERNAGRYSETPDTKEVVAAERRQRSSETSGRVSERAARDTIGHTPERRIGSDRSAVPRVSSRAPGSLPNLLELATLLDAGRHEDVLRLIDEARSSEPEYGVLRARALAAAGRRDEARRALEALEGRAGLSPDVGASCARLYVELGEPHRALGLARDSARVDGSRPLVRLTHALAAVRAARRSAQQGLMVEAGRALDALDDREVPLPSLYKALRACLLAEQGDPEEAIATAQGALGLDPRSVDALSAMAEASARIGRVEDARQAWLQLEGISRHEADALSGLLTRFGVHVRQRVF